MPLLHFLKIAAGLSLAFALTGCLERTFSDDYVYADGIADEAPNFSPAWVHTYQSGNNYSAHGDVHRLSDGTYSVLRMPGGEQMEIMRISAEGKVMGVKSFRVPQDYAGCPFMPNEETFIDNSAVLSYGAVVFRVDLVEGKVLWQENFSGSLHHSTRGFWVDEMGNDGLRRIRPLDIEQGVLEPGYVVTETSTRRLLGARLVYDANEGADQAYSEGANAASRRYIVSYLESNTAGSTKNLLIQSVSGDDSRTIHWTYRRPVTVGSMNAPSYAIFDGKLYAVAGENLLALDLATGEQIWVTVNSSNFENIHSSINSGMVDINVAQDGSDIRFWSMDGYHRVSTADGKLLSRGERGAQRESVATSEPIGNDYLLTASHGGVVELREAADGTVVRAFRGINSAYHAPVGTNFDPSTGRLILASTKGIYAVDQPVTNINN